MPRSNWGTGTLYFGKRDFEPDGSYITTEFVAAFWVPLIPFRSLRVRYMSSDPIPFGVTSWYEIRSRSRPHWKQVLSIYLYGGLMTGFVIGYSRGADYLPAWIPEWVLVLGAVYCIGLLSLIPHLARCVARNKTLPCSTSYSASSTT